MGKFDDILQHAEEMKRRTLLLKVPKDAVSGRKRKRAGDDQCDYLKRYQRPAGANRRRTDPVVVLSTILETILMDMRDLPDVQPFLFPVNPKVLVIVHTFSYVFVDFKFSLRFLCIWLDCSRLSEDHQSTDGPTDNP